MSIKLYMDHHVRRAVTNALRVRGVDVITAEEDGAKRLPDPDLLDRATGLGRVLFSQDKDLLREAKRRQQSGAHFAGVVYAHQFYVSIRRCINDLEIMAKACEPEDLEDPVEYLPL